MNNAIRLIKFFGCWVCIVAACIFLILGPHAPLVLPFGVLAIAFAKAPETWV